MGDSGVRKGPDTTARYSKGYNVRDEAQDIRLDLVQSDTCRKRKGKWGGTREYPDTTPTHAFPDPPRPREEVLLGYPVLRVSNPLRVHLLRLSILSCSPPKSLLSWDLDITVVVIPLPLPLVKFSSLVPLV